MRKVLKFSNIPAIKTRPTLNWHWILPFRAGHAKSLVIGALGGRLDQTLGNLSLLSDPRLSTYDIRLDDGVEEAFFTRSRCEIRGRPGEIVSLIPWGAEVTGISTEGLRWPLQSETLFPDRTRGISNEMLGETASISVEAGLLLVVHRRASVISILIRCISLLDFERIIL